MDLSQVTLSQMRYALAVETARSFRMASERCHVSQSGLSMQVQKLEDLLGVVLFDRSRKPVRVTQEGEPILEQMRAILREVERLGQVVLEEDEPSGPFRLGVIPTLSSTVLPLFLSGFVKGYPKVELIIEELKTEEIIARLHADTLDAGLASTPLGIPGLTEHALGLETMWAYLPPDDPLLRRKRLSQADLRDHELWVMPEGHCFRSQVLAYCGTDDWRRVSAVQFESGSFETLVQLVDEGMGATILPHLVVRGLSATRRRRVRPLVGPTPTREIGLVTARMQLRRKVTDALQDAIGQRLEDALERPPRRAWVLPPVEEEGGRS